MSAFTISPMLAAEDFVLFQWQPGVLIWTLIIFAISLPLMIKFVFGPIVSSLDERDRKVEEAAAAAEDARRGAEEAAAAAQADVERQREEVREAKRAADERVARFEQEAMEKAKADSERLKAQATADIETDRRRMLAEVREEVVNLAIASAERVLRQSVDADANRRLVNEFLSSDN